MKLLLIDNYDSFTYNLEHYLSGMDLEVKVLRNDQFEIEDAEAYDLLLISPGPGLPKDAGKCMALIEAYVHRKPILGICLGAQALAEYFGGTLYNQEEVAHGISREIKASEESWLFEGLGPKFKVGLYHSWAIRPQGQFAAEFKMVGYRDGKTLMAFEHPNKALAGIQFHPESIMTEGGKTMLRNWIEKAKKSPE